METEKKTAVLVVSFGTTHLDALEHAIGNVEDKIKLEVNPIPIFRAFTSNRVIATLKKNHDMEIKKPLEAIKSLIDLGYTLIVIQPLHVIPGFEFEKLQREVRIAAHKKDVTLQLGRPLLSRHEDYLDLINVLESEVLRDLDSDGVLWMGHGTEHAANASYVYLERLWREHRDNVHLVNIEGYPELRHILPNLKGRYKRLHLLPLLIVAGDHAKNDMAGDEDSLKTALEREGIEVTAVLSGLGNLEGIADLFANRVLEMLRKPIEK